jgi:putative copper export protein
MLDVIAHALHVILAGAWLGGIIFTTTVVSPALKSMGWNEAEQTRVRSVIGRQYAKVGIANLVLLLVFALLEGALSGFGPILNSEYALLAVLFGLVASHGAYFGRRLVELAEARKEAGTFEKAQMLALRRRRLQRLSFGVSMLNILISCGGHDPCCLRPGRVRFPTLPCKMSPDTVVRGVELPGDLLDRAAGTPGSRYVQ